MNDVRAIGWNEDCITGAAQHLEDNSCDLFVSSIPFGALFSYSHKTEDIGNNRDGTRMHEDQFGLHMRFFFCELYRVMKPGCIAAIHIQQLLRHKVQHGFMGMRDFRGSIITLAENHGLQPHGEVAIVKNPQAVARRLNLHSLMFATAYRDSSQLAPAMNDYILFFKKPGDREPIKGIIEANREIKLVEPSSIIDYLEGGKLKQVKPGYRQIPYQIETWNESTGSQIKTVIGGKHINADGWFTKSDWIQWARGAWEDIMEIDTLDGWRCAKEEQEERHVCPLQLEPVRRCIKLYSNPGDTVDDWFGGIGTVPYVALEQGRNARFFELKESYYRMACANVAKARAADPQLNAFAQLRAGQQSTDERNHHDPRRVLQQACPALSAG